MTFSTSALSNHLAIGYGAIFGTYFGKKVQQYIRCWQAGSEQANKVMKFTNPVSNPKISNSTSKQLGMSA